MELPESEQRVVLASAFAPEDGATPDTAGIDPRQFTGWRRPAALALKGGLDPGELLASLAPEQQREIFAVSPDDGHAPPLTGLDLVAHPTETTLARAFLARHGADVRYCAELGGWLCWSGKRWEPNPQGLVERWMAGAVAGLYTLAGAVDDMDDRKTAIRFALGCEGATRQANALTLAWPEVATAPEAFDADPMVLNCANGILNLATGELAPHRPDALCTKLAPVKYDPDAHDPLFDRFLAETTGGDAELANYLQRAAGYSLTGLTDEECFFLVLGPAASGKSSFVEALLATLGDYAVKASFDSFLKQTNVGQARPDIARLRGARFVAAVESDKARRLDEDVVKDLTGGDTITARYLYAKEFQFVPACKLWLAANDSPRLTDTDSGIWRRLKRIPFEREVPADRRDPRVKNHLRGKGREALLAWAVRGCLAWQREGLGGCGLVARRTAELRAEMDPLAEFIATCCVLGADKWIDAQELRVAYETWTKEAGGKPVSGRDWGRRLEAHGGTRRRERHGAGTQKTVWHGIGLLEAPEI